MKDIVDMIFKIGLLILLGVFLYVYICNSSKGRYESMETKFVLDTETGTVYNPTGKTVYPFLNPLITQPTDRPRRYNNTTGTIQKRRPIPTPLSCSFW